MPLVDKEELELLIHRYTDSHASADEVDRLNEILRSNSGSRALFAEYLNLDSALAEVAAGQPGKEAAVNDLVAIHERYWHASILNITLFATSCVLLAIGIGWWQTTSKNFATVVRVVGANSFADGTALRGESNWLKAGTLELITTHGARIVIEAPALFRFESSQRLNLAQGKMTAEIPELARGFTVVTPTGDATDLGTRFGVDVRSADTEVHVFEGSVVTQAKGSNQQNRMTANKAIRLNQHSKAETCDFRESTFVRASEVSPLAEGLRCGQPRRAREACDQLKSDPTLLAWLDFDHAMESSQPHGASVQGARWVQGRFPGTGALDFVNSEDCVQVNLNAEVPKFTLMTWIRPNRLEGRRNSIYSTDEWGKLGQVHWMIGDDQRIRFAILGPERNERGDFNVWLETEPGILRDPAYWVHLAIVYDSEIGLARQYVNGKIVAEAEIPKGLNASLGAAQLGNWKPQPKYANQPRRRLSARMDDFAAFSRAFSKEEIHAYYEASGPYK